MPIPQGYQLNTVTEAMSENYEYEYYGEGIPIHRVLRLVLTLQSVEILVLKLEFCERNTLNDWIYCP